MKKQTLHCVQTHKLMRQFQVAFFTPVVGWCQIPVGAWGKEWLVEERWRDRWGSAKTTTRNEQMCNIMKNVTFGRAFVD